MAAADASIPPDQEFLALLVHRGWLTREAAREALAAAGAGSPLAESLAEASGLDQRTLGWLRRTHVMNPPEIPGYRMGERLGSGGTAEVWAAQREKDLDRKSVV